ncbi:MAG: hypothetical protein Q8O77_14460 [Rheinheimera sp.]|nr:hypothetical protein [Rheinheimera sp.]
MQTQRFSEVEYQDEYLLLVQSYPAWAAEYITITACTASLKTKPTRQMAARLLKQTLLIATKT